jgi:hypothetical protein
MYRVKCLLVFLGGIIEVVFVLVDNRLCSRLWVVDERSVMGGRSLKATKNFGFGGDGEPRHPE